MTNRKFSSRHRGGGGGGGGGIRSSNRRGRGRGRRRRREKEREREEGDTAVSTDMANRVCPNIPKRTKHDAVVLPQRGNVPGTATS